MYEVRSDLQKNRLYITLTHFIEYKINSAIMEIEQTCLKLKPYFTCLKDLRKCASFLKTNEHLIEKIQRAIWNMGVGKVVYVTLPSKTSQFQHEMPGVVDFKYHADYANSIQEAERILDSYKTEIDINKKRTKKEMYKIVDMNGWEDEKYLGNYKEALQRLRQIRRSGKKTAVIVDANVFISSTRNP